MTDIIYKEESYKIIGACMDVYNNLGPGFKEAIYQESLELEFDRRNIPFRSEVKLRIHFKNYNLSRHYRADFLCYDSIIIEIKSLPYLNSHNYNPSNTINSRRDPIWPDAGICQHGRGHDSRPDRLNGDRSH